MPHSLESEQAAEKPLAMALTWEKTVLQCQGHRAPTWEVGGMFSSFPQLEVLIKVLPPA